MPLTELSASESLKAAELAQMKRLATGLLLLMTAVYLVSHYYRAEFVWIEFVEATAEAAMIGALADWFAVTALFRHPMGIKIPHTAIIPNKKDSIAAQFGLFVQDNFLSEALISEKIRAMELSQRVAAWISQEKNANALAEQLKAGLAGIIKVINDEDIQALIEKKTEEKIRDTSFTPMIGELLSFVSSGRRQQEMFNAFTLIALNLLEDGGEEIKETVSTQTPWWFPESLDKAIYRKIVRSVSKSLYEMQVDIYHPMRVRIMTISDEFIEKLKHSEEIREKEVALKKELLEEPALREFTQSLWLDIKKLILAQSENPNTALKQALHDTLIQFGESILKDEVLAKKINTWADDSAKYLIRHYGHEVARLIRHTIEEWDPKLTSERIELQIGKDLQFIRINGTVVGGLAGLMIHSLSYAASCFDLYWQF